MENVIKSRVFLKFVVFVDLKQEMYSPHKPPPVAVLPRYTPEYFPKHYANASGVPAHCAKVLILHYARGGYCKVNTNDFGTRTFKDVPIYQDRTWIFL